MEWAVHQAQHAARVTGREWNLESVRRCIGQSMHAVGPEIVVLSLFAVGDHGRAGRFEALNAVANRRVKERRQCRVRDISCGDRLDQFKRSWDATDGLGWN